MVLLLFMLIAGSLRCCHISNIDKIQIFVLLFLLNLLNCSINEFSPTYVSRFTVDRKTLLCSSKLAYLSRWDVGICIYFKIQVFDPVTHFPLGLIHVSPICNFLMGLQYISTKVGRFKHEASFLIECLLTLRFGSMVN